MGGTLAVPSKRIWWSYTTFPHLSNERNNNICLLKCLFSRCYLLFKLIFTTSAMLRIANNEWMNEWIVNKHTKCTLHIHLPNVFMANRVAPFSIIKTIKKIPAYQGLRWNVIQHLNTALVSWKQLPGQIQCFIAHSPWNLCKAVFKCLPHQVQLNKKCSSCIWIVFKYI